jgi:hypothetical protein
MKVFLRKLIRHFSRDDSGATLVEFAIVLAVFIFVLFGMIDFARYGYTHVMAGKATEMAVRMAVVSEPACSDVPLLNQRGLVGILSVDLPNGSSCTEREGLCVDPGKISCTGDAAMPTATQIWAQIAPLLPGDARIENLNFSYRYDSALNRVGTYYSPVVSVELTDLDFQFISPLGALATLAGAANAGSLGGAIRFPSMSASLPAEDLK